MKTKHKLIRAVALSLVFLMAFPPGVFSQNDGGAALVKQEELDQILAPVALYPDSLLAQIFMASTYPLEVVAADRWAKQNETLRADALATALEEQPWDPSVKSLVNFPQVLTMMSTELTWTQKLGDAFLAQQKNVMDTVQKLREKAEAAGNLASTKEQTVAVDKETHTIVIEPADPQIIYVPTYNPTVVYGPWWYPSYPPYYYRPPGYVAGAALVSFGVGMAVGAAWGYAWGGLNWRRGNVDINVNRNLNVNRNINRSNYSRNISADGSGRGQWAHNPSHRKGVAYRDTNTARQYNRGGAADAQSRDAFRGRAEAGRQELSRDGGAKARDQVQGNKQARGNARPQTAQQSGGLQRQAQNRSAFSGYEKGSRTRDVSNRGHQSMSSRGGGGGARRSGGGRR